MADVSATEQIEAELVLWRVFGVADVYEDRPLPRWAVEEHRGPAAGDRLQVSVGDLPDDLTLALRQWQAQKPGVLEWLTGQSGTTDERLARYEQRFAAARPSEFDDPYPLWFALRLARPLSVCAISGATLQWLADDGEAIGATLRGYENAGNRYLDGAVAQIIGAIGRMNLGQLRYSDRRAFLMAPGRAAIMTPKMELSVNDSGVRVGRPGGWKTAPTEEISNALHSLPVGGSFSKPTVGAAKWFLAAAAEQDALRRFVFAYAGLEQLAAKAENMRRALTRQISNADSNLPVNELLWPSINEELAPRSNVMFRFAVLASTCSPSTAIDDVNVCRAVVRTRNALFHGADDKSVREQATQGVPQSREAARRAPRGDRLAGVVRARRGGHSLVAAVCRR